MSKNLIENHNSRAKGINAYLQHYPVKKSCGVILFRKNLNNNKYEFLLIQKRVTYSFSYFVSGKYKIYRGKVNWVDVSNLLQKMTQEELMLIHTLAFESMWCKIWFVKFDDARFNSAREKFNSAFIYPDGGVKLREILRNIQSTGELFWEIPKGRPNKDEPPIETAIREFEEETNIPKNFYKILPDVSRVVRYVSKNIEYEFTYFIGVSNHKRILNDEQYTKTLPTLRSAHRIVEVGRKKWIDMETLRIIDQKNNFLEKIIKPSLTLIKKHNKNKSKSKEIEDNIFER